MGKIFVVASGKGGTGKSTVTAGVGAALAELGKRVLLIDTDEGLRCLDLLLGVAGTTVFDAGDLVQGRCDAGSAVCAVPGCENLFLLAAPAVQGQLADREIFRALCRKLAGIFDFVFIDAPAGIDAGFGNACAAAGNAIIVANVSPASLRAAQTVDSLLHHGGIEHRRLVINKYRKRQLTRELLPGVSNVDDIINYTGIQLLGLAPYDPIVEEFAASGRPVTSGEAGEAFIRIARRLLGETCPLRIKNTD